MKRFNLNSLIVFTLIFSFISCNKSDSDTYTITVGAFTKDNSNNYTDTGNDLVFDSATECQTWSRTAQGDTHETGTHLHYNAAAKLSFDADNNSFSWTEYGPEIDQTSIENTCKNGANGVSKTVNDVDYYQDKPNLYLKITNVVKN